MDGYDEQFMVHGVVAPDRSRALLAMATMDSIMPDPGARLRFRGLDPARRYRLQPVLPGRDPAGLLPPPWWGADRSGQIVTGAVLERAGVTVPRIFPDQVVLYRADAV